MVVVLN